MDIPEAADIIPRLLLFHKVSPTPEVGFTWMTPTKFARVVQNLTQRGWISRGLDELASDQLLPPLLLKGGSKGGLRLGIIFDDGYECIYHHALPALSEPGHSATVFIPTGFIGRANDWDYHMGGPRFRHLNLYQIKELAAQGWTIGSHTVSHRALINLDTRTLKLELADSKHCLEDLISKQVNWVAFPFGRFNLKILEMAVETGYQGAVVPALNSSFNLPSFPVYPAEAVYWWDTTARIVSLIETHSIRKGDRLFRKAVNFCARGTVIWKNLLSKVSKT